MKFSWDWLKELSGTSLSAEVAAALLTAKSFEAVASDNGVLDIDILPNRPDCLSHLGVARELCSLEGRRFSAPAYEYKAAAIAALPLEVRDSAGCPRFSALAVRGVKVGPSPDWARERLEACGLRSINNVVDVTNLVMLELGQPLHAFDLKLVDRIVVRRAEEGERLAALDDARTEYELTPQMLVVADGGRPLALAGIKGGAQSGISEDTTDILLEAANWRPEDVRAASRALGLRTDASIRFSYGVDPNLTAAALVRAGQLMRELAHGTPDDGIMDEYPKPRTAVQVTATGREVRSLLGADIGDAQIRGILESLGFDIADEGDGWRVTVPTRRVDVQGVADLAEEVARVHGYDAIPSAAPLLPAYDEAAWVREDDAGVAWDEYAFIRERSSLGRIATGAGYSEVYNYSFLSDELKELLRAGDMHELAMPQSSDYRWLRASLVPRLLMNVRDNLRYADEVRLFETGHVFSRIAQGAESVRLGLALASKSARDDAFFELKGAVDLLLQRSGVGDYFYDDAEADAWDMSAVNATAEGHRALVRRDSTGDILGFIGAASPKVASALKLKGTAAVAELDLRALIRHAQAEREFAPLPKFPSVVRDIAILVEQGVKADDILQTAQDAGGAIVEDVDVFDIFLPTGKEKIKPEGDTPEYGKSVAFRIVFRAPDRTLTDAEVNGSVAAISAALQEKLDARLR